MILVSFWFRVRKANPIRNHAKFETTAVAGTDGMDGVVSEIWTGFAAFLAAGLLLYRHYRTRVVPAPSQAAPAPPPPMPATPQAAKSPVTAPAPQAASPAHLPSLNEKLFSLASQIAEREIDNPTGLQEAPEFAEMVRLLSETGLPLRKLIGFCKRDEFSWNDTIIVCAALTALAAHPLRNPVQQSILNQFGKYHPLSMHFALFFFATAPKRMAAGTPLVCIRDTWLDDARIRDNFRVYFGALSQLDDPPVFPPHSHEWLPEQIPKFLDRVDHPFAAALNKEYRRMRNRQINEDYLRGIGQFWGTDKRIVEPEAWHEMLARAGEAVTHQPPRSVIVSGETRSGKTSFLKLLARRLEKSGWRVFQASAAEIMAGQKYIGEIEGRVRQLVTELNAEKQVAWYCGDLLHLAGSGTHQGQSASIFDQIYSALTSGRLVVFSEMDTGGLARMLQYYPSVARACEICRLQAMSESDARALLQQVASDLTRDAGLKLETDVVATLFRLAQQYLGADYLPGNALDLLNRAVARASAAGERALSPGTLVATLSQVTGLPASILDDKQKIDLRAARAFVSSRIIGQPEAVDAVVSRIAMLKAGLTDPSRPIGVFLFAGPTGTGKTELARTLAEYLFGAPDRLVRLDMSEFQTPDSLVKIIGERGSVAGSLAEAVRRQPFCVLLLDEFEKAHPNVWDLFLQVFDAGRLTDANGRVVDFRHAIVIMTSNLGATSHQTAGIGFLARSTAYGEDQVMKAIDRVFRPEFVNRIDRIIVFQPLSRDVMREILRKELNHVLRRRGFQRSEWAVEWESSAIEFLLDKGFSPDMGARPLKRAIDDHLLAPLAATLVEQRYPEGDQFLFVRSNGKEIEVEFVNPDADDEADTAPVADTAGVTLASMILQPAGTAEEREMLAVCAKDIEAEIGAAEWNGRKESLAAEAANPEIWSRPERFRVFSQLALIDRVETALQSASRLHRRFEYGAERGHLSRDLVSRVALHFHLVRLGIADVGQAAPVDALLAVDSVAAEDRDWCARLTGMYRAWAEARRMTLDEFRNGDRTILNITGFGAWQVLQSEAGLHLFEDEKGRRVAARVKVVAGPAEEPDRANSRKLFAELIDAATESGTVVRRYREKPSPLVRDGKTGWRSGKLDSVLAGNFDLLPALQ